MSGFSEKTFSQEYVDGIALEAVAVAVRLKVASDELSTTRAALEEAQRESENYWEVTGRLHYELRTLNVALEKARKSARLEEELHTDWINQFDALMGEEWDGDEAMEAIVFNWAQYTAKALEEAQAKITAARVWVATTRSPYGGMTAHYDEVEKMLAILEGGPTNENG